MNKKNEKIKKLYNKGFDEKQIARRLGYSGGAMTAGVERVREGMRVMGIEK